MRWVGATVTGGDASCDRKNPRIYRNVTFGGEKGAKRATGFLETLIAKFQRRARGSGIEGGGAAQKEVTWRWVGADMGIQGRWRAKGREEEKERRMLHRGQKIGR